MEERIVKLDLCLAKKFLKNNNLHGDQNKRLDAIARMELVIEKERQIDPNGCWTIWVYLKFDFPNEVLSSIVRLYKRFPRFAEFLVFMATAEGLEGVHLFLVHEVGKDVTVTDFVRI